MNDEDVYDEPCGMCGEPIQEENWLFDDRSVSPGEERQENVLIHDRCAG